MKDESSRQYAYLTRFLGGDRSYAFPCQNGGLGIQVLARTLQRSHENVIADEWIYSTLAYSKALRYQHSLQDYEFQTST